MIVTPENRKTKYYGRPVNYPPRMVCDFEICIGEESLKRVIATLNCNRFDLVAVTQTMEKYTVFFRRPSV